MTTILAMPLSVRLLVLFALGLMAGGVINWAVYRWAWYRRAISPWSAPLPEAPRRVITDRIPVWGWLGLRREEKLHGPRFWLRPCAVELLTGVAFVGLYLLETQSLTRLWAGMGTPLPPLEFLTSDLASAEHWRFVSHVLLMCFMLAASLIDLDEKTIPDAVTIPGTLVGLLIAVIAPWSLLPAAHHVVDGVAELEFLQVASPEVFPEILGTQPGQHGLTLALGCWAAWCFALLPRVWNTSRGWTIATRLFFRRLYREPLTWGVLIMAAIGTPLIVFAASRLDQVQWAALVTALVGLACGGGIIWCVRIIGQAVLKKEAMGFGDVTLMAMIGATLGWQACLIIFFVAPFFALLFAIANLVLHREHEIPYGPFLCLGAGTVVLKWPSFWEQTIDVFALGWLVPGLIAICMVMMALLLGLYRGLLQFLGRGE